MKLGETLVFLGIFVVLPTIIVWLVLRYKKHETDKRAEMALAAIEKGSDLDLEAFFRKMNPAEPHHQGETAGQIAVGLHLHQFWRVYLYGIGCVWDGHRQSQ